MKKTGSKKSQMEQVRYIDYRCEKDMCEKDRLKEEQNGAGKIHRLHV